MYENSCLLVQTLVPALGLLHACVSGQRMPSDQQLRVPNFQQPVADTKKRERVKLYSHPNDGREENIKPTEFSKKDLLRTNGHCQGSECRRSTSGSWAGVVWRDFLKPGFVLHRDSGVLTITHAMVVAQLQVVDARI